MAQDSDVPHADKPSEMRYEGTYSLKDARTVVHKVEKANDPARVGKELVRHFALQDSRTLVITGENVYNKFRIVWKKEP